MLAAMYEQVEIIWGEAMSLTCLYNISNQDSEVNVYSKDRKASDVVATWIKLDLTVEKAFEKLVFYVKFLIDWNMKVTLGMGI